MTDPQAFKAVVFSVAGETLQPDEAALFKAARPFGFILFARNCRTRAQLKKLTDDLRECVGWHAPVLIDQEGGRVMRMKPPEWPAMQPALCFGDAYGACAQDALAGLAGQMEILNTTLREVGIDVNCLPVLDVLTDSTNAVIGDRAFGADPQTIGILGDAVIRAHLAGGVTPVMKHMPGHGRAVVDSHLALPVVTASVDDILNVDCAPFAHAAAQAHGVRLWGMSAHVVYAAIDSALPGTLSETVISTVIRGRIGFHGVLVSDDLSMLALDSYGSLADRAEKSLQAGCDLALYCAGKLDEMRVLADRLPGPGAGAADRLARWKETRTL